MGLKIQDLIDIEQFQMLQERLNEIYSFPSSIIDNDGNILTATGWQDICTKFHRQNPECEKECIKSDQYILSHLHEANPAVSYQCPHGLIDNATPIIIAGVHYGNYFTGQFFLEPPDLNFFRAQAKKYGFVEEEYIEAVKKVPVWTQEQLNRYLFFIKGLIEVISGVGLKNLKEIEARKKARESEERHRTILQTAMDGFWVVDTRGQLLEVNETYSRMSGYSVQELLTMSIPELEAVETTTDTAAHIQNIMAQREDRFESRHRRKDGSVFDVEVSVQYQPIEGGRLVAFIRDITGRKLAEGRLRESEERYRNLFNNNHAVMLIIDPVDASIKDANPAACSYYGWSREDLMRRKIDAINTLTEKEVAAEMQLARTERRNHFFFKHRRADGTIRDVDVYSGPIMIDGNPLLFSIIQDITERKQAEEAMKESEEKFRLAFMTSSDAYYWSTLEEGLIIEVNPVFEDVFGYSRDEAIGRTSLQLGLYHDPIDRARMLSELKAKGRVNNLELRGRKKAER